jgi:starch synthase (maltosyl-transferring)
MARPRGKNPLPRLVIERVSPELDGGRHPVKRAVGARLRVEADIYKDGHGAIGARVRYRPPGERGWSLLPLAYAYDPDRWHASFDLDRVGRWQFTVEAWAAHWETWTEDLHKWKEAGEDLSSELLEGAALLRRAARHQEGRAALADAAHQLEDPSLPLDQRLAIAFSGEIAAAMAGPLEAAECTAYDRVLEVIVDRPQASFAAWYELFPRSQASQPGRHGNFADVERRLPRLAELGFDVVYLPPIHPIGRSLRKGPNGARLGGPDDPGSPWAIGGPEGGHTAIHPELGTLEDFERLVARAKSLGMEIALDIAFQCSPNHPWVSEHPGWFRSRSDGSIRYAENPPKKYQDIYPLDFWCEDREALWQACLDVFLFWAAHGVGTFRVDNPHTKPFAFWEWAVPELQRRHPDAILLAEAFTRPKRMKGLAKLGFNQSYTYFTWKNTSWELREYLEELVGTEMTEYFRPNFFTNTPDILHAFLQEGGRPAFRIRLVLAATLSPVYGIYSGFELCEATPLRPGSEEYLHSEKYEIRQRDWEAPGNLDDDVRQLNRIRREHPALQQLPGLAFLDAGNPSLLAFRRSVPGDEILVVVNLDPARAQEGMLEVPLEALGIPPAEDFDVEDLLTGARYTWRGPRNYVRLDPAQRVAHVFFVRSARGTPRAAQGAPTA